MTSESERLADDGCPNHDHDVAPEPVQINLVRDPADETYERVALYLTADQAEFFRNYLDYLRRARNLATDAAAVFAAVEQVVNSEIHL